VPRPTDPRRDPDLDPGDRAAAYDHAASQAGERLPGDRRRVVRLAAYGLIHRADGAVLICRVAPGYPAEGWWTLPGGGLDFGETPEAGAIREVEEETGLVARITGVPAILSDTGIWPRDPDVRYHQVRFVYPMELIGGEERVEADGSTDAFGWFDLATVATMRIVPLISLALGLPVIEDEAVVIATQSASSAEASSA
jgi:ADP-ribose pyrophosphatase YjhB (NUDIX family)